MKIERAEIVHLNTPACERRKQETDVDGLVAIVGTAVTRSSRQETVKEHLGAVKVGTD